MLQRASVRIKSGLIGDADPIGALSFVVPPFGFRAVLICLLQCTLKSTRMGEYSGREKSAKPHPSGVEARSRRHWRYEVVPGGVTEERC
jgi:hypothetical protein